MLSVRTATANDIEAIMAVYSRAREFMAASGNPDQWGRSYPPRELIEEDVASGICRVVTDEEGVRGVFALPPGEEPTYRRIEGAWLNDEPYVTIHRIASDGKAHGILRCALDHCAGISRNVRIDTHEKNLVMQGLLGKYGFRKCGTIFLLNGSPRLAYQRADDAAGDTSGRR